MRKVDTRKRTSKEAIVDANKKQQLRIFDHICRMHDNKEIERKVVRKVDEKL